MSPCPAPLCQDGQEGDRSDKNPPGFHGQVWAGSGPSPWLGDTEAHPPAPSAPGWVHHPGWVLVPGCLGGAPQLPDEGQAPRVFSSGQVRAGPGVLAGAVLEQAPLPGWSGAPLWKLSSGACQERPEWGRRPLNPGNSCHRVPWERLRPAGVSGLIPCDVLGSPFPSAVREKGPGAGPSWSCTHPARSACN